MMIPFSQSALIRALPQLAGSLVYVEETSTMGNFVFATDHLSMESFSNTAAGFHWTGFSSWRGASRLAAEICAADVASLGSGAGENKWPMDQLRRWAPIITPRIVRFCPACMREGRGFRILWLLEAMVACTRHQCMLEELSFDDEKERDSYSDRQPFTWVGFLRWPSLRAHIALVDTREASVGLLRMAQHIEALAYPRGASPSPYGATASSISLFESLRLVSFLGRTGAGHGPHPLKRIAARRVSISASAVAYADQALANWPIGFDEYLTIIRKCLDTEFDAPTFRSSFGFFYDYLFKSFAGDDHRYVRAAFVDWALREHPGLVDRRHKRISAIADPATYKYVDGTRASKALGIGLQTLAELIRGNMLPGLVFSGKSLKHRRVLVAEKDLHRARGLLANSMTVSQARAALGVSKGIFAAIAEAGLVWLPEGCIAEKQLVRQAQVVALQATINGLKRRTDMPVDPMTLRTALVCVGTILAPELLKTLLAEEIRCWDAKNPQCDIAPPTSVSTVLSRAELNAWRIRTVSGIAKGRLSVPQLAAALGFKQEVIYHLVRSGRIRGSMTRIDFREESLVDPGEVARFVAKHATVSSLKMRTSSKYAVAWLKAHGIQPVAGPTVDGCRLYLFERTPELIEAAASYLDPVARGAQKSERLHGSAASARLP